MKRTLFIYAFITLALVGAFHLLASEWSLYWAVRHFDSFMHFLGGVCVGFATLWLIWDDAAKKPAHIIVLYLIAGILIVGVVWEIFELYFGISVSEGERYWNDTITDLIMDTIGTLSAGMYVFLKK